MTKHAERQDEKFIRDVSAIKNALQSIAKDLHYFRKKDEAAAAVEEPKYTCKDCTEYREVLIAEPNELAHWCRLHGCTISNEGLKEICDNFERSVSSDATE